MVGQLTASVSPFMECELDCEAEDGGTRLHSRADDDEALGRRVAAHGCTPWWGIDDCDECLNGHKADDNDPTIMHNSSYTEP